MFNYYNNYNNVGIHMPLKVTKLWYIKCIVYNIWKIVFIIKSSQKYVVTHDIIDMFWCQKYVPWCLYLIFQWLYQVDRLEDELMSEQEKYKAITEELEQTFAEMSGY